MFSAVDATTAAHLVQNLFGGSLLAGRTCVLVTHHVDLLLPVASVHVAVDSGKISKQSKIEAMRTSKPADKSVESARNSEALALLDETKRKSIKGQTAHVEGWTTGSVKSGMYST